MLFQLENQQQELPEYEQENLNEVLKIQDDPINEMSNYDIEEEEKERQYSHSNRKYSQSEQLLNFENLRKSQENSFQKGNLQDLLLRPLGADPNLHLGQTLNEEQQISNVVQNEDDGPTYEDFLITNAQQCSDLNQDEKLSQCSEPANIRNIKISQKNKHMLTQKSSSSFRYDTYDLDVNQDYEGNNQETKVQQAIKDNYQQNPAMFGSKFDNAGENFVKIENQKTVRKGSSRKPSDNTHSQKKLQDSGEVDNNIINAEQDNMRANLISAPQTHKDDQSYEKLNQFDQFDQSQINIVNKGPRRPLSPYIFFSQEKRKELKREHPDWNSQQIMKMVSVLWQKMSADEKRDFQEQSKKDRERYENERQEFVTKKHEDDLNEDQQHTVLETVKNRSRILKQQQMDKRKLSEDHIYYPEHLTQRKGKRSRRDSNSHLEDEVRAEINQDDNLHQTKRQRKLSRDHKLSHEQLHQLKFEDLKGQNLEQDQSKDQDTSKQFEIPQQSRHHQLLHQYSSGSLSGQPKVESTEILHNQLDKIDHINQSNQQTNQQNQQQSNQGPQTHNANKNLLKNQMQGNQQPVPYHGKEKQSEILRQGNIGNIPTNQQQESLIQKQRILPSPMVSSTSLQNFYPLDQQYPQQAFIRSLPSPSPQTLNNQRLQYQQQFQPQYGQHYYIQQPYIGLPGQQIGQFIQPQIGNTGQFLTATTTQDQFLNPTQQVYLLSQQQPFFDQNLNLQALQSIPQGNPQNPPHAPIQQQNSSHELAQLLQQHQANPPSASTSFHNLAQATGNNGGGNQNNNQGYQYFEDGMKQPNNPMSQLQQINIAASNYPNYSLNQNQNQQQQYYNNWGNFPAEHKILQRESSGLRLQVPTEDDFNNDYQNNQFQRISSTNLNQSFAQQPHLQFTGQNGPLFQQLYPNQNNQNIMQNVAEQLIAWDNQTPNQKMRNVGSNNGVEEDPESADDDNDEFQYKRNEQ